MSEEEVKFSGILKLVPSEETISQLRQIGESMPPEAVLLPEKNWHVTLIHQSILKPFGKQLKQMGKEGQIPEGPLAVLSTEVEERVDEELGRKSWVVWLENQEEMRGYVNQIMEILGGEPNPEPTRKFHISLANLTGNASDSVR